MIKVASLFSGVGGLDWGFHKHGGFSLVFANDFDEKACDTYQANFHPANYLRRGDITKFLHEIPPHDLLLGGFPCQAFSLAGKREGFADSKGRGLHYETCRSVLLAHKPSFFIFENVGGLVSHNKGKSLETIVEAFKDSGYKVTHHKIKMNDYGVPQRRVRLIFFGVRSDIDINPEDLIPAIKTTYQGHPADQRHLKLKHLLALFPALPSPDVADVNHNYHIGNGSEKVYWMKIVSGQNENLSKLPLDEIRRRQVKLFEETGEPCRIKIPKSRMGYRRLNGEDIAPTMLFGNTCLPIHPYQDRSISVREAAYIQGFPKDFVFKGGIAAQYKQVGNAVPPQFSVVLADWVYEKIRPKVPELTTGN